MTLAFRNLTITPEAPVSEWPTEAVQTALEPGDLADWHRIVTAIRADPWGKTARIGTSASRLSTYTSGKVTPSATLMLRIRHAGRPASG